ncbi:probable leucine-rich repeat receptor-like protein kinase At1g68400 [Macadamia integrifolia]|uniref:probable leucine-rich repeat receptor-like protein kinase At1g68400 n=1 Tax=Macadamia integrifolia TaxID=60698 RepID=UPI001C4EA40C|nr:probable leucine-rich repeat receptor-like protein kinase At1g68400 [Macadamia integrifolia]
MSSAQKFTLCFMVVVFQLVSSISFGADGSYLDERNALFQLRDSLNSTIDLHSNWTGLPCYGDWSNWAGISCSNWHVIQISLDGIQLTGSLPPMFLQNLTFLSRLSLRDNSLFGFLPNFTNLDHLQYIILSHNRFSGSIPPKLINLPLLATLELQENTLTGNIPPFNQSNLTVFNVSYNLLQGLIPKTPILQRFPLSSFDYNSQLCGNPLKQSCPIIPDPVSPTLPSPSPSSPSGKSDKVVIVRITVSIAVVAVALLTVVSLTILWYRKTVNRKRNVEHFSGEGFIERVEKKRQIFRNRRDPERTVELDFIDKDRPVFDLDDLLGASSEQLGTGKLGSTYKATLECGSVLTVKRLEDINKLISNKDFVQQMQLLGKKRHENLVEIISFYYSKDEKLIVYEYVNHGSLFELLHGNRMERRTPVKWSTRLSIVRGVAEGLNFLHQSMPSHKVPHANLKSSNILIDLKHQKYHPKLTDFGFLPLLSSRKSSEMLAAGRTPEFSQAQKLTHKTDVYCFGIVLLEVITGRIPEASSPGNDDVPNDLAEWAREVVNDDWSTDVLDIELVATEEGHCEMFRLTEIALDCTAIEPEKRPRMSEVLRKIEEI